LKRFEQGPIEYVWKKLSYKNLGRIKINQSARDPKVKATLMIILILSGVGYSQAQNRMASTVLFQSGEETIEGILVRPDTRDNTPAVVFQQGSGPHAFEGYETQAWGPHKYYIEDVLLELGYAVLYCNKRGLGNSTGNWRQNDFYGRAEDAYAGVQYLRTLPFIDASRIGISGHSQGGWISQIVASQHPDIAFIICLAGPATSVQLQVDDHDRSRFICEGYSGEKLEKKIEKRKKSLSKSANLGKKSGVIGSARHWYLISEYDNKKELKNLTCPSLFLFGEFDINVDPEINIKHLKNVFDNEVPENITCMTMPGGNHGFYKVENKCVDWDTAAKSDFDPEFQNEIRKWLLSL
jgi:alpha/beta superfamily hydrolase